MGRIYRFFEWEGKQDGYGAYGFERWEKLHTGPGQYNWAPIDNWLQKQGNKPTAFAVCTHLSQLDGWESFADCTPAWVYDGMGRPTMNGRPVGKIVTYTDKDGKTLSAALPYYNDQTRWWKYLSEFVAAFGARYDGVIGAIFAGPGLDIENQPSKSPFGDGNQSSRFGQLCMAYSDWHKAAFKRTPVFVVVSIGQGRKALAQHAAENGQGIKHNGGFVHDLDSHQGYDNYVGSWDAMQIAADNGIPTWVESAYGFMDKKKYWWAIYASLHYHPAAVDIHSGLLDALTLEQRAFTEAHVGVTAETAPGAWCVLRDMEYPIVRWTGSSDGKAYGCSGHPGDWNYYMHRVSGDATAKRVENVGPSDAPESRQCRLVTSAEFAIDDGVTPPPYELSIRWLNEAGAALRVEHGAYAQEIISDGTGAWQTARMKLSARQFKVTSAGAHIHMLYASPIEEQPEPPEPGPELDTEALWQSIQDCQADIDEARREAYQAREAVRAADAEIANAARALQAAVDKHDEADKRCLEAMNRCDLATGHLADMRATLEAGEAAS